MLHRYRIVRGKRAPDDPLPDGQRIDTRKHTRSVFRPDAAMVARFLDHLDEPGAFDEFRAAYLRILTERFATERAEFDSVAQAAREGEVHIGCNCPTGRQPDVRRCHTTLALEFMRERYPDLRVDLPASKR